MDDNLGTEQLNVLPNELCANVLKIWQRLAATGAALEIFERKKYVSMYLKSLEETLVV